MRKTVLLLIVVVAVDLALGFSYLKLRFLTNEKKTEMADLVKPAILGNFPSSTPSSKQPIPPSFKITNSIPNIIYLKNFDLLKLYPDGKSEDLTNSHKSILQFAYSTSGNNIAYIAGKFTVITSVYSTVVPDSVFIKNLKTGEAIKIISYPEIDFPNSEYSRKLRDVKFSADGKKLAVTSSDSVWTYDLETKELKLIFSQPFVPSQNDGRPPADTFAYSDPIFSASKKYLLINRNHYEGNTQLVLNLETGKFNESESYSSGQPCPKSLIGWRGDTLVGIDLTQSCGLNPHVEFFTAEASNYQEKPLVSEKDEVINQQLIGDDLVYIKRSITEPSKRTVVIIKPTGESQTIALPTYLGDTLNPTYSQNKRFLFFSSGYNSNNVSSLEGKTSYIFDLTQLTKGPIAFPTDFDGNWYAMQYYLMD